MRSPEAWLGGVALVACIVGCKGSGLPFVRVENYASVAPDPRLEGAGHSVPTPDEQGVERQVRTFHALGNTDDLRFLPTRPEDVVLLAGRDRLDDYLVLGVVSAGDNGGIGASPERYGDDLKRLAALLGADAVLDVHLAGSLQGLAVRRREKWPQ